LAARFAVVEALGAPDYRRLWLVGLCLNTARWIDLLALGWLALALTGSPLMVGVAAFCRTIPQLALGPFSGVLADRLPHGRLLLLSQGLALGAGLTLVVAFGTGLGGYWTLVALELALGASWALDFPVRRTVLFTLVGTARVTNAISLETVSMQLGKMAGPVLGGLLLGRLGAAGCYAALVLLYVAALALTLRLRLRIGRRAPPAAAPEPIALLAGAREVWARPTIRGVLVITVLMNVLVFPYQQMLPVFARDVLRIGPELLGLLVAADGFGALVAALAIAAHRGFGLHAQLFAGGSMAAATLLLGFAASPWYGLSLALLCVVGLAESGFATMQSALVLLSAPAAMRGRAMGVLSACIGAGPFGTLWIGLLASYVGAPLATGACSALALVLMLPVALRMLGGAGSAEQGR
jgi:MFS family permease